MRKIVHCADFNFNLAHHSHSHISSLLLGTKNNLQNIKVYLKDDLKIFFLLNQGSYIFQGFTERTEFINFLLIEKQIH